LCNTHAFSEVGGTSIERLIFGVTKDQSIKVWVQHFSGVAQNYSISISIQE